MRVGVCARSWGESGGIGVYTRQLIEALVAARPDHEYHLLFADPAHRANAQEATRQVFLPAPNKALWDQWAVARYARKAGLDTVLHTKLTVPFLAPCATAMTVHGTERFVFPEYHRRSDLWYFRTVYRQYLRRASLILAVSETARRDVIHYARVAPERVVTVHLAAEPLYRPIADRDMLEATRQRYGLPPTFLLFVGHIYPGKNFGRLLRAFARLAERGQPDVKLVVAGGVRWNYRADMALLDELRLRDRVHFAGSVPAEDLVAFYNLARATVYPSHYESFGLVNLEANACGCPLITSRTGGSPEAAGDAALYVDPFDVGAITDAMERLLTEPALCRDLIARGYANAARFSWSATATATAHALDGVVARRAAGARLEAPR